MSGAALLQDYAMDAARDADVAVAAGVAATTWADASVPRVFAGLAGYLSGRNRGRLPFIEVSIESVDFGRIGPDGIAVSSQVRFRVHLGGRDLAAIERQTQEILSACLAAFRADHYADQGEDRMDALVQGPWGHQRDAIAIVEQTGERGDMNGL